MENLEFKVLLSDWEDFGAGDIVWIEEDAGEKYISVKNPNKTIPNPRKFKIIGQEPLVVESEEALSFSKIKYTVSKAEDSVNILSNGTVSFYIVGLIVFFHVYLQDRLVNPKSGSGGGLQK